jgi:hypothetical protein
MTKYPEVDKLIAKVAKKDNFKVSEVLLRNRFSAEKQKSALQRMG